MGLLNGLKKLFVAKSNEAEQKIEDANIISFSEQDLRTMTDELAKAKNNYGTLKATQKGIERDKATKEAELSTRITQTKALKEQGKTDLAIQVAEKCVGIKEEIAALEQQRVMITGKVEQQQKNVDIITANIDQAKRDLQFMKAQDQVIKSTESIAQVNTQGNTLSKFNERKEKMQQKMDKADAILEAETSSNLDNKVEEALGLKNAKAQNLLDSL